MASSVELEGHVGLLEEKPKHMSLFDCDDDEEDCLSDLERYFEEVKSNDGFDVVTVLRCELMGAVTPIPNLEQDTGLFESSKKLLALATEHYNKEHNANYKFLKVVKLHVGPYSQSGRVEPGPLGSASLLAHSQIAFPFLVLTELLQSTLFLRFR